MIRAPTPDAIQDAAALIRAGQVVAVPTETVYGLAANACDDRAVARIFALKQRPAINPLIVHVPDTDAAEQYAAFNNTARSLAAAFWPGPLTLVLSLRSQARISAQVTAGLSTIAIRVPAHRAMLDVLRVCNLPLAAPSANRSGRLSATTPQHVTEAFGVDVPLILASGMAPIGLESTVLDLTGDVPHLLRYGAITADQLAAVLGQSVQDATQLTYKEKPRSPGQLLRHYAPRLPLRLGAVDVMEDEALLAFGSLKFMGLRGGGFARDLPPARLQNLSEKGDVEEAAHNLFAALHILEQSGARQIAVMDIPAVGIGLAIRDRLTRAAAAQQGEG